MEVVPDRPEGVIFRVKGPPDVLGGGHCLDLMHEFPQRQGEFVQKDPVWV